MSSWSGKSRRVYPSGGASDGSNAKEDYQYDGRRWVIVGIVIAVIAIYVCRLFSLQLLNDEYKENAENNAFLNKTIYPTRGVIYDRQGRLLVFNQPAYDVMVCMRNVHNLHTLFADEVASAVVVVGSHLLLRYLAEVAQHMACVGVVVLADGAQAGAEAGELVELFGEPRAVLYRQLAEEHLIGVVGVAGVAASVLDVGHTLVELLAAVVER